MKANKYSSLIEAYEETIEVYEKDIEDCKNMIKKLKGIKQDYFEETDSIIDL